MADVQEPAKFTPAELAQENFNISVSCTDQAPDDTELIEAYDRAIKQAKEKIMQRRPELKDLREDDEESHSSRNTNAKKNTKQNHNNKGRKRKGNKSKLWGQGNACRAVFSQNNQEYEAVICSLNPAQDECVVKYVGYGNKETVALSSLKPSHGPRAILEQKIEASAPAECTAPELNESFFAPSSGTVPTSNLEQSFSPQDMAMPPLPPPAFLAGQAVDQSDSLSAVLMAWYMAGYHTGRYEASLGLRQSKVAKF